MIKHILTCVCVFLLLFAQAQQRVAGNNPVLISGQLIKEIKSLKSLSASPLNNDVQVRDEKGIIRPANSKHKPFEPVLYGTDSLTEDPALQKGQQNKNEQTANAVVNANFNGIGYTAVNPPDPTLCVGPNHIIQMVNGQSGAFFKVYNKSGVQLVAQTYLDNITGRGGLGDPIAQYDQFANRFILTEFVNAAENGSEGFVFAVSQTSDPTGGWFVYFFSTGSVFPDYPKFSIWTDAIYGTTNDFAPGYIGSSVYAIDKAAMYAGAASAALQSFRLGSQTKFFSMSPVLLQGTNLPPAGTGGLIAYMADDAWTATTADIDSVGLFEFRVNFGNPALTTVVTASSLASSAYNSTVCTATRGQCITMPGTSNRLEALQSRLMNQPVYRKFGSYEGIVFNHVVNKGSNIAGVRWYELRKTTGSWFINQQSTYSPDNNHRWMAGICYDQLGNIGLAYNISSSSVRPGLRFTGRKVCDANNIMTETETVIVNGTASNASTRYGDYSHLVSDPDGIRFWVTGQYNASSLWTTRIAAFTLNQCAAPVCSAPGALATTGITASSAVVSWSAVAGAISYSVEFKTAGSLTWVAAGTTTATSFNLTSLAGSTVYDWRVLTNCASGSSNFAAAQFTTAGPAVCNAPTNLSSSNISSFGAVVSWTAVASAISYTVQIRPAGTATWIEVASTLGNSLGLSNLNPSTLYDWRVRSNCETLASDFSMAQFTTLAIPVCTAPTGPVSGNITATSAQVSWTAAAGAVTYSVDYKPANTATWIPFTTTAATSVTITALSANTLYDWRVQSNCVSGSSAFIAAQFTTTTVPAGCDAPTGLSGLDDCISTVELSWNPVPGAASYRIEYKLNTATTWIVAATANPFTSQTISGNPGLYNWRVQANCNGATSSFSTSTVRIFTVAQCNQKPVLTDGKGSNIKLLPQPADQEMLLNYEAKESGAATVQLVNPQGSTVLSKQVILNSGNNVIKMDVSKLPPGLYTLRLIQRNEIKAVKALIN